MHFISDKNFSETTYLSICFVTATFTSLQLSSLIKEKSLRHILFKVNDISQVSVQSVKRYDFHIDEHKKLELQIRSLICGRRTDA